TARRRARNPASTFALIDSSDGLPSAEHPPTPARLGGVVNGVWGTFRLPGGGTLRRSIRGPPPHRFPHTPSRHYSQKQPPRCGDASQVSPGGHTPPQAGALSSQGPCGNLVVGVQSIFASWISITRCPTCSSTTMDLSGVAFHRTW